MKIKHTQNSCKSESHVAGLLRILAFTYGKRIRLLAFINAKVIHNGCEVSNIVCTEKSLKYRNIDGSCNNLKRPWMGVVNTTYRRVLPQNYKDGIYLPQTNLPSARKISTSLFPDKYNASNLSQFFMQWGQLVTHDILITFDFKQQDCCLTENREDKDVCLPILWPVTSDSFYSKFGVNCISLVRNLNNHQLQCNNGLPAEQINSVTHLLDASDIYGSTQEAADKIRTFKDGKLKVSLIDNKVFLPKGEKSGGCTVDNNHYCFLSGDVRINQNPTLIVLTTVHYILHNKIADKLKILNPHWEDETFYQEARKIVIAIRQHLTYNYWLPPLLGNEYTLKEGLLSGIRNSRYDDTIDFRTFNEMSATTFRTLHASIQGQMNLVDESNEITTIRISNHFQRPGIVQDSDNYDKILRGMATQHCRRLAGALTSELSNLMAKDNKSFGDDLTSIDIQRGRDRGIASYTTFLWQLFRMKVNTFEDLKLIPEEHIPTLKQLYQKPQDIDLFTGVSLEKFMPGAQVGPSNRIIIAEQFKNYKFGDRFWFENNQFTYEQLSEIRKITPAKIMCDGSHNLKMVPKNPFFSVSNENPLVSCDDLPKINFHLWKSYN